MRLRSLLSLVLTLACLIAMPVLTGCQKATTPTEAAALRAAETDTTAYTLTPDQRAKATALSHTRTTLHFTAEIWAILQLWLILQLGLAARMRNVAVNLSKNRWAQGFTFFLQFLILTTLLNLPLTLYAHHVSIAYGLSVQSLGSFLLDDFKSFLLTYLFGGLAVMLLFLFIRKFPRRWWIPASLAAMLMVVLGIFATPYVIDPLFNKFEPLSQTNPALVDQLEKVVARGKDIQIPPERMFLMRASAKVTTLNAYVTGFGSSKRVVVWDTSVAKGTPQEISFIFGHEMGHYVLGHIVQGVAFAFALILIGFFLAFHAVQFILKHKAKPWRVHSQDNWAALVVLLLVFSVFSFLGEPIGNTFSRSDEHAADVYGLEAVHGLIPDPQAAGRDSFQLLGASSFSDPSPSPFVEFWTYSHPSIGHRAAFSAHYNPWAEGAQPKYFSK